MVKKTVLNKFETAKIKSDLKFLSKIINFSKKQNFRLIVSGGYGLDGILKIITRPHNDLDLIIYSQEVREKAIQTIKQFILKRFPQAEIAIAPNQFLVSIDINTKSFGCNIYFVETVNDPVNDINTIKLADGKTQANSIARFPLPVKARLNKINFEAENPNLHLADIQFKRKKDEPIKYTQDIINLKTITKPQIVKLILAQY
jgi:hypothetical protein